MLTCIFQGLYRDVMLLGAAGAVFMPNKTKLLETKHQIQHYYQWMAAYNAVFVLLKGCTSGYAIEPIVSFDHAQHCLHFLLHPSATLQI